MKKHKTSNPVQPGTSNSTAELFVLPPELLAKLGIDLSKINNSEVPSPVRSQEKGSNQNTHNISKSFPESTDASSIIETANLMKESVFLSPTFLQTPSNEMLDEEPADDNEYDQANDIVPLERDNTISSYNTDINNITEGEQITTECIDNVMINSNPGNLQKQMDAKPWEFAETNAVETYESIQEYQVENQDGNLILKDVSHKKTADSGDDNNFKEKSKVAFPVEEHPDEAYMSDCSNSYSGCSPENNYTEVNKQKISCYIKEKPKEVDLEPLEVSTTVELQDLLSPMKLMSGNVNDIHIENESFCDPNVAVKYKQSELISTKQLIIEQPEKISDYSKSAENVEALDISSAVSSDKLISWTPVGQKEKVIEIAKIQYDAHNSSVLHVTDETKTQCDKTKSVLVDSDCTFSLENAPVSELNGDVTNNSEITLADKDALSIVQNKIKHSEINAKDKNFNTDLIENKCNKGKNIADKDALSIVQNKIKHSENNAKDTNLNTDLIENKCNKEKNIITNSKTDSQDRVKEIAAYLSQIANERKKKYKNTESNIANILSKTSVDPIKSKLCIQGVEKPGGKLTEINEITCSKVSKTYQRKVIQKQIPAHVIISEEVKTLDLFQVSNNHDTDIQGIKIGSLTSQNEFCICYDFGNLAYYDCEMLYEHVHFWQHKNINCDSETLYSIYNDDCTVTKEVVDFIEDGNLNERDDSKESGDNICLNIITSNDATIESAISDSSLSEEANSSSAQIRSTPTSETVYDKRVKNRKRSAVTTDQDKPKDLETGSKKIKCGVCNQLISEIEWETHKETEHNSIAWKADQEIDFKNNNVLKTLSRRLKLGGYLKCPICNTEIKHLLKFTQHMRKCIKQKKKQNHAASSKALISEKITRRSTRNSSNADIDLPQSALQKHSYPEINDVIPRSIRRMSKVEKNDTAPSVKTPTSIPVISTVLNTPTRSTISHTDPSSVSKSTKIESSRITRRSLNVTSDIPLTSTNSCIGAETDLPSDSQTISTAIKSDENCIPSKQKSSNINKDLRNKKSKANLNLTTETVSDKIEETLGTETDECIKTKTQLSASSKSSRRSAEMNKNDTSQSTTSTCNDKSQKSKINKTSVSVAASQSSRKSTNVETSVTAKPTKRSSNIVTSNTPVKKAKTTETDDHLKTTNRPFINSNNDNKQSSETPKAPKQTNQTTISTTIGVVNQSISKKHAKVNVNDTTASRQSTEIVVPCSSANTECDLLTSRKKYVNSKILSTSTSRQLNIVPGSSESCPLSESAQKSTNNEIGDIIPSDKSLIDSVPKELPANIALNDPQTSKEISSVVEVEVPIQTIDNVIKCGVCEKSVGDSQWMEHISKEHHYIAWRDGESPLEVEDQEAVRQHLQIIAKQNNGLTCSKCGLVRKMAKPFLRHLRNCDGSEEKALDITTASADLNSTQEQDDDSPLSTMMSRKSRGKKKTVTCGVCSDSVEKSAWIDHIRVQHKYLAWVAGETPLNTNDEKEVKNHLNYISKYHGGLICSKCGSNWSYVKKYLLHEQLCGTLLNNLVHSTPKNAKIEVEIRPVVKCGVCKQDVEGQSWIKHIQVAHRYLAWVDGETPVDVGDREQVKQHLSKVAAVAGELICAMCGVGRRFVRSYLMHVDACTKSGFSLKIEEPGIVSKDQYECGVCHEKGPIGKWKDHAMSKHYNIAWMTGELPINLRNFYAVEKYLKDYQKKYNLACKVCKVTRASCYGFYAHVMTCGKTEKELDEVQNLCEICNNKYLCIYRNQHLAWHKEQGLRREQRETNANKPEKPDPPAPTEPLSGKRRAAQKAKQVIEKYSSNMIDGKLVCPCGATFENAEELAQHSCSQKQNEYEDSDVSVKMEPESEPDSLDTDIDSNVSEDEEEGQKKKRKRIGEGSTKITRMSYRVNNYTAYLTRAHRDFCALHYTSENLFNEWRDSEFEVVSTEDMAKYLPPLTESCKVRFGHLNDEWMTYKRFESKKIKGYSLFTGGAVQCMSWAPQHVSDETPGHFLAVSAHVAPDVPRHAPADTPAHPALLQIWDFKAFNFPPTFSLGLAHEFGVVWGMSWCPSGARDLIPHDHCEERTESHSSRLGLLAIACSNGGAYILAVPYPPKHNENEQPDCNVIYKLKPVAELRVSMTIERRVHQATSISWSQQKGHDIIIVGYSDGTTALYDLNTVSPFLKAAEDGVAIFYPFQDKRSENTAITGVDICPTANESYSVGGYASASVTGAQVRSGAARAPSVRTHLPATAAFYSALWPALMLAGDAPFTVKAVNELEWWGGGRRLGATRAAAACARCARAATAAAPAVRLLRAHPCYPEVKKLIVATFLMVPLGQKGKRKQVNDDLSVVVEPLTYEDAIAKYGLEMYLVPKSEQNAAQKVCNENELCPERFPLSDVVAAAFVPSARFHDKLALATHSGMIFVINT